MNVDTTLEKCGGRFGAGIVVRDDLGVVHAAAAFVFPGSPSVDSTEAKAIWYGLKLAVDNGWPLSSIESNSLTVVKVCKGELCTLNEVDNVICDIQSLLCKVGNIPVNFAARNCNVLAHNVARWALSSDVSVVWNDVIPSWLRSLASVDVTSVDLL
ncbi:hypothetical protein ACOSQ2_011265 [Xanthoceras sorbifolium]